MTILMMLAVTRTCLWLFQTKGCAGGLLMSSGVLLVSLSLACVYYTTVEPSNRSHSGFPAACRWRANPRRFCPGMPSWVRQLRQRQAQATHCHFEALGSAISLWRL